MNLEEQDVCAVPRSSVTEIRFPIGRGRGCIVPVFIAIHLQIIVHLFSQVVIVLVQLF